MARRAALRASGAVDEPNVILALASSYNERGVAGFTHSITNSEDQRKINCFYEIARNAATGKGTLTLSKRPGVTVESNLHGASTQDVYLIGKGAVSIAPVVIAKNGNNINAANSSSISSLIFTDANYFPAFLDKTITYAAGVGTEYLVLQTRRTSSSFVHRVWYANLNITWTEITDADFTAIPNHVGKMEHMDGFAFIMDGNNIIWNSDNNSISSWTSTNFIAKQIYRDRPVGLAKVGNQIIAFGENTAEPLINGGTTTGSPLVPVKHLARKIGLVPPDISLSGAGHYYCTINDRIYFVGRDGSGQLESDTTTGKSVGVYTYNSQNFEKISPTYIDKILSEVCKTSFYSVNTIGFNGMVAACFLLTSPNATSQRSLLFFPETREWFEWTSTVFSTINDMGYFLPCGTGVKDRIHYFSGGDNWQDNGTSYPWSIQFRQPSNGSSLKFMPMYGVDADTDTAGLGNTLTVEASDDDCVSFTTLATIDLTQDRKVAFNGGSFRKRVIRLGNTNSRPTRIHNWLARVE